ncbi:hypothetical protein VAE151_630532 [Vibrio aestuarianus]|uniref:Uncharacterized protein n=1 Tax=Vibrio aestuarianus TaxID=28171 RepID=A0ABM9FIM4_9VIBR|nr:hypothetical protein VAE063_1010009 [Vibrio aestuarianus]CAH8224607.1 hypothetical protein VIBAE_B10619 [Vibrio aestuarianus subsp. francensis]CAH8221489.1 hypothetical protein VAE308_1180003 [Vibrio aestuarianus]CAH8226227.1 hypothetical protein VAE128_500526 [Vibrio aestuarianus]CAH8226230.1 hypothetical protein VAE055_420533 [Vibrio aestuarianus]
MILATGHQKALTVQNAVEGSINNAYVDSSSASGGPKLNHRL